tara:strand:+ start:787 stop:1008 length:222 start_codon:yes stop_codon:yes gene_type:complete
MLTIGDTPHTCILCEATGSLNKVFGKNSFIVPNKSKNAGEQSVGTITKEYIEKNREILNQQKKEAKSKDYEPT